MANNQCTGILEILPDGFGFLRDASANFVARRGDPYVSARLIRQWDLREGLHITGSTGKPARQGQAPPVNKILKINEHPAAQYAAIKDIKLRVSIDPEEPLTMQRAEDDVTGRMIDLLAPIGRGQRGMVISPPKAGKTMILKHVGKAILQRYPEIKVNALLIDERPEEITDFQRDLIGAQVFHSSADRDVENHLRVTRLCMNMATREVEFGNDVFILIDSLTRMGRAFNKDADSGGKTLSGGLAANALELPRRFFGAARNLEDGGSLTILATILIETNSRMDEVIFQEFKGTGNMDLVLSRECAERRLYPAINIRETGTRKEHKLLSGELLEQSHEIRRRVAAMRETEALQYVLEQMKSLV